MTPRPVVLVHGYSAAGSAFDRWKAVLADRGYAEAHLRACTYESLTNEVTIKDLAEGFDRALRLEAGLDAQQPFDALVHSTGMLVLRAWLAADPRRRRRLGCLVGLAPATFGSPLAHKGRGWLGALFRGNRELGPDFMEAGDRILDGLELGSRFTWELAHRDLIGEEAVFGPDGDTPYAFVFCGTGAYPFPLSLISEDGTDGTVRLAGAALNTRKIDLDLTLDGEASAARRRVKTAPWSNADVPLVPVEGLNHATILSEPTGALIELVLEALEVRDAATFEAWQARATAHAASVRTRLSEGHDRWQQINVRVTDERSDPVPDYYLEFIKKPRGGRKWTPLRGLRMDVHPYGRDASYRCFHVNLDTLALEEGDELGVRLTVSSGTERVAYQGYSDAAIRMYVEHERPETTREWDGIISLATLPEIDFFHPCTTTLVEIRLNREPQPPRGPNELLWFPSPNGGSAPD